MDIKVINEPYSMDIGQFDVTVDFSTYRLSLFSLFNVAYGDQTTSIDCVLKDGNKVFHHSSLEVKKAMTPIESAVTVIKSLDVGEQTDEKKIVHNALTKIIEMPEFIDGDKKWQKYAKQTLAKKQNRIAAWTRSLTDLIRS